MSAWFFVFVIENVILVSIIVSCFIMALIDWRNVKRNAKIKAYADLCAKYGHDVVENIKLIVK